MQDSVTDADVTAKRGIVARMAGLRRGWPHLLVIMLYMGLTLWYLGPLVGRFSDQVPYGGDTWIFTWDIWWVKKALLELHTNPFYTTYVNYPGGASLYFHTLAFVDGLLALPIQMLGFNLFVAYNCLVFFAFVGSAYGTFLLADYYVRNKPAAFVAGLIFAFSPIHFSHLLGHLNFVSLQWMPFYVLFMLKAAEPRPKWRDAVFAAIFLALTAMTEWEQALFLVMLTLLYAAWLLWRGRGDLLAVLRGSFLRLSAVGLLFVVLTAPVLLPLLNELRTNKGVVFDPKETLIYSADLQAFVTPYELHPIFGDWATRRQLKYSPSSGTAERTVYLGITTLILVALGLFLPLRSRRDTEEEISPQRATKSHKEEGIQKESRGDETRTEEDGISPARSLQLAGQRRRDTEEEISPQRLQRTTKGEWGVASRGFWALTAGVFGLLSLGPILHFGGKSVFTVFEVTIPLPYALLYYVPFFSIMRTPARFVLLMMLALAVLAAWGVLRLARLLHGRLPMSMRRWADVAVAMVVSAFLVFEFAPTITLAGFGALPAVYQPIVADPDPTHAVLELPNNQATHFYIAQLAYNKPMVGGHLSRPVENPIVAQVPALATLSLRAQTPDGDEAQLRAAGVKYVVVNWWMIHGNDTAKMQAALRQVFGRDPDKQEYEVDGTTLRFSLFIVR